MTDKPSRKRKRLELNVFGRNVKVGCIPGPLHSDVRTMLLKYVREVRAKGRHQSIALSATRLENVDEALRENGDEVKSLNDLRNMVQHRYNSFSVSAESIDTYYTEKRAEGYNKVCAGPQYTMSKRCVELSGKIKKHALVLDVACGSGLSSDTISKEYGFGVIGCDVSSGMLSKAKSEGKRAIDYVRTDMSQPMPFRSNVFDTAFSVSAIHYLAGDVPPRSGKARMSTFSANFVARQVRMRISRASFMKKEARKRHTKFTRCCIGVLQGFRFSSRSTSRNECAALVSVSLEQSKQRR